MTKPELNFHLNDCQTEKNIIFFLWGFVFGRFCSYMSNVRQI